jgi:hypothetical protein
MTNEISNIFQDLKDVEIESAQILQKAHKRVFDIIQTKVDRLSSEIFSIIQDHLKKLKKDFPKFHIILMPYTTTFGNDIGPKYGVNFTTEWFIFAIDKNINQQPIERIRTVAELTSVLDAWALEDKLMEKISNLDIRINLVTLPPHGHLKIILSHDRYNNYEV